MCFSTQKNTRCATPTVGGGVRAACAKSVRQQWKTFPEVQVAIGSTPQGLGITVANESLVGGWTNPSEKYESKWVHLPQIGVNKKKHLKPPPRSVYVGISDPKID